MNTNNETNVHCLVFSRTVEQGIDYSTIILFVVFRRLVFLVLSAGLAALSEHRIDQVRRAQKNQTAKAKIA